MRIIKSLCLFVCLLCLSVIVLWPERSFAQGPERRAFKSGGPENLVRVGHRSRDKLLSAGRTSTGGFEFSTTELYEAHLYLDEEGARKAFEPFRGQSARSLAKDEKFQQLIIDTDFPKMVVLTFDYKRSGRDIREDVAEQIGRGVKDAGKFLNYLRKDFEPGNEVVIRFSGQGVMTTVAGTDMEEIQNPELAKALLKMFIGMGTLSDADPLLK
ncbi:MAG TPA: hypothetical protein VIF81_04915 [Pyrinomonadaceae bacterium]|jgi:hypothetical protein